METIQVEIGPHGSCFLLLTSMQANATSHVMGLQTLETIRPSGTIHAAETFKWKQTAVQFILFKPHRTEDDELLSCFFVNLLSV